MSFLFTIFVPKAEFFPIHNILCPSWNIILLFIVFSKDDVEEENFDRKFQENIIFGQLGWVLSYLFLGFSRASWVWAVFSSWTVTGRPID